MSALRSSFATRLVTSLALIASLTTAASAHVVRPHGPPAPIVDDTSSQFAQPPHKMPRPDHDDMFVTPTAERAAVRAALAKARQRNLAAFGAYQKAGVFPSNTFGDRKLNVWRDADGHFCAAATIIRTSGDVDLVDRVAEQNNFIRLADVTQGPLMDWILTSGFTQEEIAAIQEPFMPVAKQPVEPTPDPLIVDAKLRAAENARLRAKYRAVDRMLVASQKKALDIATDRLMKKNPELAWKIASAE